MKKNNFVILLFLMVFILLTGHLFSQPIADGFISAFGIGVAIPSGDFGATSGEKGGYAKKGFTASLNFAQDLDNNLEWVTSGIIATNPVDETAIEKNLGLSVKADNYVTSWLLTGIGMKTPAGLSARFFLNGQVGLLFSSFPNYKLAGSITQTTTSKMTMGFAFNAGVKFEYIRLEIRYLSGEPTYKREESYGSLKVSTEEKLPVGLLVFQIGLIF